MERKLRVVGLLVLIAFGISLEHCKKKEDPIPVTTITSFVPGAGEVGTTVVITGASFDPITGNNVVQFNGSTAIISNASATQLTVTVPAGATTGKITIVSDSRAAVASGDNFTVIFPAPTVTSFTPTSGVLGKEVIITGTNFSTTLSSNVIKFNGTAAVVSAATTTSITTNVPAGATTGLISVVVNGLPQTNASLSAHFVIPPPTLTLMTPDVALPAATVTLKGTNFSTAGLSANKVKFNGTDAVVTDYSETQLIVNVPDGATTGPVTIDVGGQVVSSVKDFTVLKDIPRAGLVLFYPFSGNANDASGNGHNAATHGNPSLNTDRFGGANRSYTLDGVDDNIFVGAYDFGLQVKKTITLAGWVYINKFEDPGTILSRIYLNSDGTVKNGYQISQVLNGKLATYKLISTVSSSTTLSASGGSAGGGEWVFFALTINDKDWKFYKNSSVVASGTETATILSQDLLGDLVIGNYNNGSFFNGAVDDITVYDAALGDADIQKLFTQTITSRD